MFCHFTARLLTLCGFYSVVNKHTQLKRPLALKLFLYWGAKMLDNAKSINKLLYSTSTVSLPKDKQDLSAAWTVRVVLKWVKLKAEHHLLLVMSSTRRKHITAKGQSMMGVQRIRQAKILLIDSPLSFTALTHGQPFLLPHCRPQSSAARCASTQLRQLAFTVMRR